MRASTLLRLALGGVLGAGARWGLAEVLTSGSLPWPLLVANTVGCGVLGAAALGRSELARGVLGAGVAGGLTSTSALALWLALRLDAGEVGDAASAIVVMLLLGGGALLAGERLAAALLPPGESDAA